MLETKGNGYSDDVYERPPPYGPEFIEQVRRSDEQRLNDDIAGVTAGTTTGTPGTTTTTTTTDPSLSNNDMEYESMMDTEPPPPPYNPEFLRRISLDESVASFGSPASSTTSARPRSTTRYTHSSDSFHRNDADDYQRPRFAQKFQSGWSYCRQTTSTALGQVRNGKYGATAAESFRQTRRAATKTAKHMTKGFQRMEKGFRKLERKIERQLHRSSTY